jgi:uncharacterized protein DUF4154
MRTLPNAGRTRILATMGRIRTFGFCAAATLATLLLAVGLGAPRGFAQATASNEYQVKAAFLYNFGKFVEWPNTPSSIPFNVCVFGHDPFGHALDQAVAEKKIGDRPISLTRVGHVAGLLGCQIVFVSSEENSHMPEIIGALRGCSVLLVGESEEFAGAGGTIQFFIQDNRVRFVINTDAADRAGLKISSKLLALASIVHETRAGGKN